MTGACVTTSTECVTTGTTAVCYHWYHMCYHSELLSVCTPLSYLISCLAALPETPWRGSGVLP